MLLCDDCLLKDRKRTITIKQTPRVTGKCVDCGRLFGCLDVEIESGGVLQSCIRCNHFPVCRIKAAIFNEIDNLTEYPHYVQPTANSNVNLHEQYRPFMMGVYNELYLAMAGNCKYYSPRKD